MALGDNLQHEADRCARIAVVRPRTEVAPLDGRFASLGSDKLRGGYYTPGPVAAWLCRWAIRTSEDTFVEPSCGDGEVLLAGVERLRSFGAAAEAIAENARGIELIGAEADAARQRLAPLLGNRSRTVVRTDDFFAWLHGLDGRRFTAAIGNPPFIRYQSFPEPARSRAMAMMAGLGLKPNKLTNIWVPFVVAATEVLREGGRLALVVPAEILQVTYAAQLRSYLTERFARITLVTCNQLIFNGAEQEVILLLAEEALPRRTPGNPCRVAATETATLSQLLASDPHELCALSESKDVKGDKEKWLKYFLTSREIGLMRDLRRHRLVVELSRLARVDVGVVTGKNDFFVLRGSEIETRRLKGMTSRLVSRSSHLRGAILTNEEWTELAAADERVQLLNLKRGDGEALPPSAAAYVASGETERVHLGYKCSIRKPWFHVPALWVPDGFLFRQIHDFPRFVLNTAGATSTDTIHRFATRDCAPDVLVAATYTHLTAASAEIEGRSYGGGVLELEPTESERLLLPNALGASLPLAECDALIRAGRLATLLQENDRIVLRDGLGLDAADCAALQDIWMKLRNRRFARGKRVRRAD